MPLAETSLSSLMWLLLFAECGFRLSSVNTCIGRLNKHRGTSSVDRRESNLCVGAQSAFAVCYADASRPCHCVNVVALWGKSPSEGWARLTGGRTSTTCPDGSMDRPTIAARSMAPRFIGASFPKTAHPSSNT